MYSGGAMEKKITEKSFCKWEKDEIKQNIETLLALTTGPRFVCAKCARVARHKVNVCKPFDVQKRH